jgi:hypothetical protein
MPAICKPYESVEEAEAGVAALLAEGVPGDGVRLLMAAAMHDARQEARGTFAGARDPQGPVGTFAGARGGATLRGSFAATAGAGPEGGFGTADRDVVLTYADGEERARVAGHHLLKGLLMDAGLDADTAEADVRALHDGRVLVVADLAAIDAERARAALDGAIAAPSA